MLDVRNVGGPVDLRRADPKPGEMGSLSDALVVAAGSGGAITALAGALVSWLHHRTTDVTVKITRPDGTALEVEGRRVRGVDAQQLSALIEDLAAGLGGSSAPAEARKGDESAPAETCKASEPAPLAARETGEPAPLEAGETGEPAQGRDTDAPAEVEVRD
jgi:Effector Associated Constant Component 1